MVRRISAHLKVPLFRNGYALVVNTVAAAGLGAAYWVVAARLYSIEDVGVNAAMISAMVLLAKLAQFNLVNALNRFIPSAGGDTARLIVGSYLVTVPLAGVAAAIFLMGLDWWAPELAIVRSGPLMIAGFIAATMVWTVFVLQDAALTGLHRATWIPIENSAYGIVKIAVLAGLAAVAPAIGIFASWTIPLVLVLVPVNVLMFRRAVPTHIAATRESQTDFRAGEVARFAAADFFASLSWTVLIDLLPVVVLVLAGAEANAYFFLAWAIAYTLFLIAKNTGMSLIAEAAVDPARLRSYSRKVLIQTGGLVVPIAAVLIVAAPWVLRVFGAEYAAGGTTVLRLLAAASIPNIVIALYTSMVRIERRMKALAALYLTLGVMVLGLSVVLLDRLGIAGIGWAWLATLSLLALVLLVTELRMVWLPAALDHRVGRWALGKAEGLQNLRRPKATDADSDLEAVMVGLRFRGDRLRVLGRPHSDLDLAVASIGVDTPESVVKVAKTGTASASVLREAEALRDLHSDHRLAAWSDTYVPRLYGTGDIDGRAYLLQQHRPGVDGRTWASWSPVVAEAVRVMSRFHAATATNRVLDDAGVERLVSVDDAAANRLARHGDPVAAVVERVGVELTGRPVTTSWIHGDLWLGNLLVGYDGEITGILDWGGLDRCGLPAVDVAHLLLTNRALASRRELGSVVMEALEDPGWTDDESAFLADCQLTPSTLVLLTWLHHVASNLRKSDRYRANWLWWTRNIDQVVSAL
jgi:O-antigen/teichoic acid export membrane protein